MEQTNKLLVQVKSDIEHLANKVQFLKAVNRFDLHKIYNTLILNYYKIFISLKFIVVIRQRVTLHQQLFQINPTNSFLIY